MALKKEKEKNYNHGIVNTVKKYIYNTDKLQERKKKKSSAERIIRNKT